ncbi:hypothetical protein V1508DRAFT_419961 [Lipomyces doorenjongii]|uniref:uncharacterized protein n=1 Tax=Lipomyces doorenjongii TaxID=383834 RepID=UPI0034CFF563
MEIRLPIRFPPYRIGNSPKISLLFLATNYMACITRTMYSLSDKDRVVSTDMSSVYAALLPVIFTLTCAEYIDCSYGFEYCFYYQ